VVSQSDIDVLLNQAEAALASIDEETKTLPDGVRAFKLEDFSGTPASTEAATLDLMRDVQLDVTIELGRTHMHLEEVLQLQKGAVVPLDKLAGDPVDIFINGRLIARGEVLVLNDNFCVRVAELITGESACA
jgi:flagellar motor switch protein FliN/FliY